eukprot:15366223-Ditylum_brightwellii.AAC.1
MCLVTTAFALIGNDFKKGGIAYKETIFMLQDKSTLKLGKSMGPQIELRRIQSGHCCPTKPLV